MVMKEVQDCPHCRANLRGEPIPTKFLKHYGGKTHFRREIGCEHRGIYDGVLYWKCPDCGGTWHRWPRDHRLHEKAEPYIRHGRIGIFNKHGG